MKAIHYFFLGVLFLGVCIRRNSNAQGIGNHITFTLDSALQTSNTTFQFNVSATSDGDSATSDLRANAFQFGINYDTLILNPGDSIIATYMAGTSAFIPPLNPFYFPAAVSKNHIRMIEGAYTGGNTGNRMTVNQRYKIGTFQLRCANGFVNGTTPHFTLQDSIIVGKTACLAVVWKDSSATVSGISGFGTGDGQLGISINTTNLIFASTNDLAGGPQLELYPNPATGHVTIHGLKSTRGFIEVSNIFGESVLPAISVSNNGKINDEIDVTKLAAGVYLVKITTKDGTFVKKLIKEKSN